MGAALQVETTIRQLERQVGREFQHLVRSSVPLALNRTGRSVITEAKRRLSKAMGIPQKTIKPGIFHVRASRQTLSSSVIFTGRPIPLIHFKARETARGVTAAAWAARRIYPGTFIATMPTGHRGVYRVDQRRAQGRFRKNWGDPQLPIRQLYGPSLPRQAAEQAIDEALRAKAQERFAIELERQYQWKLSALKGRR